MIAPRRAIEETIGWPSAALLAVEPVEPQLAGSFVGEIRRCHAPTPPERWVLCDGAELQIAEHPNLFAVFGTEFGGDGEQTFALPTLTGSHEPAGSFMVAVG